MVGDARGSEVGSRKLDEEPRADGEIIFDVDAAPVFGDDASGDSQAEAGAAVLGREMGEEKLVFVLRRDAVAGVGDADFDGFGVGVGTSGD